MEDQKKRSTRIFMPSSVFEHRSCVLMGWKDEQRRIFCVTSYMEVNNEMTLTHPSTDISCIGLWENDSLGSDPEKIKSVLKKLNKCPQWVYFTKTDCELPRCTLYDNGIVCDSSVVNRTVVIIYDALDIHVSNFLQTDTTETNLDLLSHSFQKFISHHTASDGKHTSGGQRVYSFIPEYASWVEKCQEYLRHCMIRICLFISTVFITVCDNRLWANCVSSYLPIPASIQQVYRTTVELHTVISKHDSASKRDRIRLNNVLCRRVVDVLLGISVMYFVMAGNHTILVADTLMAWAQYVATELQKLLQWMMGVPAGLKLNQELANFLGQFFLYHIYLWSGYLKYLSAVWTDALWYISVSGCLGLSVQLAFIQDLLSMMTLHSYCFYVYAARLYHLQMTGLVSLWRLFRGKKWNPLFQRVDHCSYDVDQLFIGTLVFTILLFLLPTTGLFYVMFTGLRLVVLSIQGTVYKLMSVTEHFPLYLLYLRLFKPNTVAGDVRLHVLPSSEGYPLYHSLQLLPVSMSRLFDLGNTRCLSGSKQEPYTWNCLLNKIIYGRLIYPWIEISKT